MRSTCEGKQKHKGGLKTRLCAGGRRLVAVARLEAMVRTLRVVRCSATQRFCAESE